MKSAILLFFTALQATTSLHAVDFSQGEMQALPVPNGTPPEIDADLSDWDLSAQEPIYISAQTADSMNAEWAVMYDEDALYISSVATMPNRPFFNNNNPQDAYWYGDLAQVRLSADPSLTYPLRRRDQESGNNRIAHISFWKNTETDEAFMAFSYGTLFKSGSAVNPEGSEIALDTSSTERYILEAKIPWSALNVPDGKNPFEPGESGVFTAESLWIGGDTARTILNYNQNPGVFAFRSPEVWGKLLYAEQSPGKRIRPEMEEIVAEAQAELQKEPAKIGVPFTVEVPVEGLKVSINIIDEDGSIIREVIGGEEHPAGPLTVYWDGRDSFQKPVEPGEYSWAAYFHEPLKAVYQGGVGASGDPFYNTLDGKGAWGGDHSNPIDVDSDEDSLFFLWPVAEAGKAIVRTDYDGNVIWRKNPFVGGGFGPFFSTAANDTYVFLSRSDSSAHYEGQTSVELVRILKSTGALTVWNDETGKDELTVVRVDHKLLPEETIARPVASAPGRNSAPYENGLARQPDGVGLAADNEKVYVGSYGAGKIFMLDAESGESLGEIDCPGVRGLDLTEDGDLYAVSFPAPGEGKVLRFPDANGPGTIVIDDFPQAPRDVAVAGDGTLYVSVLGEAQQVWAYNADGEKIGEIGTPGGRPWQGSYDPEALSFLRPAGITIDSEGALLIAESSPPKVFSRVDLQNGELLNRWYGPGVYWNGTWPMPDDPTNVFYQVAEAIARADLAGVGETGVPNAYWDLAQAGYPHVGNMEGSIPQPEVIPADNGELYFVKDSGSHAICVFEGDLMRPIATWTVITHDEEGNHIRRMERQVKVWIDQNGDGQPQDSEISMWDSLGDGSAWTAIARGTSSMHMEPNGDLYFMTPANAIIRVPAKGFAADGRIEWDLQKSHRAVSPVLPGVDQMHTTYRTGLLGTRLDEEGNIYTLFNTRVRGTGSEFDFADEKTAKRMLEGMGHTSRSNLVKFAKFDPEGNLIWMAGRKATAGAGPGEMYHFWNMAGLVNDRYIAGGSEWGQIYLYTHDGFFVDALMNNPGESSGPGPYTFGGETAGGRVAYFEESGDLWVYTSGMTYRVDGFSNGKVERESRATGTVTLDRFYELESGDEAAIDPITFVRVDNSPLDDSSVWSDLTKSSLATRKGVLAEAQFAYDEDNLYARIQVEDPSPLENAATENKLAFKGGDTAGFVVGPARHTDQPGTGDVRFMAARIQGEDRVIAMKAVSDEYRQTAVYETPAAGRWEFDFVGEVPGAEVSLEETDSGYVAEFSIPRSFLEFDLSGESALRGDVEIRLSGVGQRGLQAVSRQYLFTPSTSETTMVDDIPTEARLYPQYWGRIIIE